MRKLASVTALNDAAEIDRALDMIEQLARASGLFQPVKTRSATSPCGSAIG
jgi:hypothetical protein